MPGTRHPSLVLAQGRAPDRLRWFSAFTPNFWSLAAGAHFPAHGLQWLPPGVSKAGPVAAKGLWFLLPPVLVHGLCRVSVLI
jgi:hypothetical protein